MAEGKKNIFDDMLGKVKDFAEDAAKKTSEIVADLGDKIDDGIEAAKDKVQIEKIEYSINKKFRELGNAYYKKVKTEEVIDIESIIAEIDNLYAEIEKVKADDCEECCEETECCEGTECCEETECCETEETCCETVEAEVTEE